MVVPLVASLGACAPDVDESVELEVTVLGDTADLTLVVENNGEVLVSEPVDGATMRVRLPEPVDPELSDLPGWGRYDEAYLGVRDGAGFWRGFPPSWLLWCEDCPTTSSSGDFWLRGWNRVRLSWQNPPLRSDGFAFEVDPSLLAGPLVLEPAGNPDADGLPRALLKHGALVVELGTDGPIELGPDDRPPERLVDELAGGIDNEYEIHVPGLQADLVAYHDDDGSGGWTDGDRIVAELCAGQVVWVDPDLAVGHAHVVQRVTGFRTGWTVSTSPSGEDPVAPDDWHLGLWCTL